MIFHHRSQKAGVGVWISQKNRTFVAEMEQARTFAIHTLGCKLNFSESSDIARKLEEAGFVRSDTPQFIILNSCAVTAVAEKKARNLVAPLHREYPGAHIVVVGCYAALRPQEIQEWPGVVATFGNADKTSVVSYLLQAPLPQTPYFFSAYSSHDRTRSFLKIQDGCDYHCTYCTVWKARGESRSDNIDHVLQQIEELNELNFKEINITGVNLGDFGRKEGSSFYQLLCAIEEQHFPIRFRISSIEPNLLTDEIIHLAAQSDLIMPHFHIPLQSANDRILGLMHRRYQRELFKEKVMKVKACIPHACIALDVITGFPSETEEEFEEGLSFIRSLPISYLHVFTYSRRPGTPAADMKEQVPPSVKKERTARLIRLSDEKKQAFYHQHIGETRPVLWECESKNGCMFGFTDNYIKLRAPYRAEWVNQVVPVSLSEEMLVFDPIS